MSEQFDPKEIQKQCKLSTKEVEDILLDFEKHGLVWKRFDVKTQEFVYYRTDLGHKIAQEMGLE